jgi:hypothetical protein
MCDAFTHFSSPKKNSSRLRMKDERQKGSKGVER